MKIAIIALHFAEYSISLANALAEKHEVLIVLHGPNFQNEVGGQGKLQLHASLRVVLLPHSRSIRVLFGNIGRIVREIRGFEPDVLHIQEEPKDYLMGALPFLTGYPKVLTVHDPVPHSGIDAKLHNFSRRALFVAWLRRSADQVIVHGRNLRQVAIDKGIKAPNRIAFVNHGALGKLFNVKFHKQWKEGYCLFFGRIEAYKGLGIFIEAIKLLREEGLHVKGVVAGRGTELDKYKDQLRDSSAFSVISRYLSVDEVLGAFSDANVVVLPYLEATQSGVSAYAVGVGRPVVATRVGGLPESVQEGVTGILVEPGNARALADAIAKVVTNREYAESLAEASFAWGEQGLSWKSIAAETMAVYSRVL